MRIQHPYKIAVELTTQAAFNLRMYTPVSKNGRYLDIVKAIFNVANARCPPCSFAYPSEEAMILFKVHLSLCLEGTLER